MLRLISSANTKPRMVTARAVSFRCRGTVIRGTVVGGMLLEIMNPAKTLPISRCLMELIRKGLFSLMEVKGEKRVCPSSVEKIMWVL